MGDTELCNKDHYREKEMQYLTASLQAWPDLTWFCLARQWSVTSSAVGIVVTLADGSRLLSPSRLASTVNPDFKVIP
ncbi:hypothetical protein FG05_35322 [Fusarium graminearum]|nr:hypothetical protein FG05_35322 [Fusarium graminearum]